MLKKFENNYDSDENNNHSNISLVYNKKVESNPYTHEYKHMFDFIVNMSEKLEFKEIFDIKYDENVYKYYKKEELIIPYYSKSEVEKIWLYYLSYCLKTKQRYKSVNILKKNIQSMIYSNNNPVIYKKYTIEFEKTNIKVYIINEIVFRDFLSGECSITLDNEYLELFLESLNSKVNMKKEEIINHINYYYISSYIFTKNMFKSISKIDNVKIRRMLIPIYGLSYLYTIENNYSVSLKNRIIYYNKKPEKEIFERIHLCLDIIVNFGFVNIFDLNKIKIDEQHKIFLFNYIIKLKNEIKRLFRNFEIDNINRFIIYINIILKKTFSIFIRRDRQDLFYICGLENLDCEIITYKNKNIINKIREEEEIINKSFVS